MNSTQTRHRAPGPDNLAMAGAAGSVSRTARLTARALSRRCPNCGARNIFSNYLQQRGACPGCSLRLDRGEPDFFIGAYTINLIVAELMVVFGGLAVALLTWPDVPWTGLTWGLAALMVAAPVALYPFSRQLWLACDLVFQPAEDADFVHQKPPQAKSPM
jgi:uncharacterized protein (DUF983 family)